MRQRLLLKNALNLTFASQPVRQGVPWPKGAVPAGAALSAWDENGRALPCVSKTLARWPDGSAQWTLLDLCLDMAPGQTRAVEIASSEPVQWSVPRPVRVEESADAISLRNERVWLSFPRQGPGPLVSQWRSEFGPVLDQGGMDVLLEDQHGKSFRASGDAHRRVFIEEQSPLVAVVRIEGKHVAADGCTLLDYFLRFRLCADGSDVTITYHYHNLERGPNDGELPWILLRRLELELHTAQNADCPRALVHAGRTRQTTPHYIRVAGDLEICSADDQDLDHYFEKHQGKGLTGGGNGRVFVRDINILGEDFSLRPWYVRTVVDFKFGSINDPNAFVMSYLGLCGQEQTLVAAGLNMMGLHPKSLRVDGAVLRYAIWPQWAGMMDVTQGEGRTLQFCLGSFKPGADDVQIINQYLSWENSGVYSHWSGQPTVQVSLDPAFVRQCAVFGIDKLPAYQPDERFAFERKLLAQWAPDGAPAANGHWHYGDVFYRWEIGANNEEMAGHQWFQEYLRSGRPNCLHRGMAQAQHIADVDVVAYSSDSYQNGGMCAHGPRHNRCAAYPSHMWFTELFFAYALSGDGEYLTAAKRVCENLLFWINDEVGYGIISADGREAGQPLINLAWAYPFIGDERYLQAMNKIIRGTYMAKVQEYGRLVYPKPRADMPLILYEGYGDWAAWEGMFCVWELTRDEELRTFLLGQLDVRVSEGRMATHGIFRDADYNAAAYAYYLSGDERYLRRVGRAFSSVFRCVAWPLGYIKSMYYIKLAFEHGIVRDEDVLIS